MRELCVDNEMNEEIKRRRHKSVGDQNKETEKRNSANSALKMYMSSLNANRRAQVDTVEINSKYSSSSMRQLYTVINTILFEFIVLCHLPLYNLPTNATNICVIQKVTEASASLVRRRRRRRLRLMTFLRISLSSFQTFYERLISITSILLCVRLVFGYCVDTLYCVLCIVPDHARIYI